MGATGAVGREILKLLAERNFPASEVVALASPRSTGQNVSFGDKAVLKIKNLETFDFTGMDIGLFSPGAAISAIEPKHVATRVSAPARLAERMKRDMVSVFPQLGNPRIDYAWAGLMGYTRHFMPLIGSVILVGSVCASISMAG